jgi:hypothetical protein
MNQGMRIAWVLAILTALGVGSAQQSCAPSATPEPHAAHTEGRQLLQSAYAYDDTDLEAADIGDELDYMFM